MLERCLDEYSARELCTEVPPSSVADWEMWYQSRSFLVADMWCLSLAWHNVAVESAQTIRQAPDAGGRVWLGPGVRYRHDLSR
jgi:hypothetical protein